MSDADKIYPQEWLQDKNFKVSKNIIEVSNSDIKLLQLQQKREDYMAITHDIIANDKHPFDEITYFVRTRKHYIVADVRNNRCSDYACVMRIVVDRDHVGNLALGKNGEVLDIRCLGGENASLVRGNGLYIYRLNKQFGYYTLSCHSNRQLRKIGTTSKKESKNISTNDKPKVVHLRDSPTFQISTFTAGQGSKPSYEFGVRGHIRRYKNGREVFIKPYVKCKGRGKRLPKSYTLHD